MSLVSVIMPCFNHGAFVAESIASIQRQSHAEFELLVVDDGSNDDSRAVVRGLAQGDPRVRLIALTANGGASAARNVGLEQSRGEFVCFCDADDQWLPEKLEVQLAQLRDHPDGDIAYADALIIDEAGRDLGQRFSERFPPPHPADGNLMEHLCRRNFINIQTVMLRRACLDTGLHFDPSIRWVEDWQFWIQLSRRHTFVYSVVPLAKYRVHRRSTSLTQQRGIAQNRFKVLRRTLATAPDVSPTRTAELLHHLGCALRDAGRPRLARRILWQSIRVALANRHAVGQCLRPLRRLVQAAH